MVRSSSGIGLLIIALLALPSMAMAQKVVVLPVSYELVWTGEQAAEPAERVQRAVQRVARFVGYTALEHSATLDPCDTELCLERLAAEVGADEVIHIAITDNDGVDFTVAIQFASHEPLSLESSSSFDSILGWIEDQVAVALQGNRDLPAAENGGAAGEGATTSLANSSGATVNDSLRPNAFWIALGSGTALLAAGLTLDLVVWRRSETLKDQEPEERDQGYWETTNRLQIGEIVMFSAAGAALVTAGILAFLTDFSYGTSSSPKSREAAAVSVAPWFSPSGAGLSWSANF